MPCLTAKIQAHNCLRATIRRFYSGDSLTHVNAVSGQGMGLADVPISRLIQTCCFRVPIWRGHAAQSRMCSCICARGNTRLLLPCCALPMLCLLACPPAHTTSCGTVLSNGLFAMYDLRGVCVSLQDLQKSLSRQGSPSISPALFGSHMTTSSGADANSPALSLNSAPSSTPNDHSFDPGSGSGSLAKLARPADLNRVSSGYHEPGELLLLKKCSHIALQVCHACCCCPAFVFT